MEYTGERAAATVEYGPDGRLVRFHPVIRTVNLEERIRLRLNWSEAAEPVFRGR